MSPDERAKVRADLTMASYLDYSTEYLKGMMHAIQAVLDSAKIIAETKEMKDEQIKGVMAFAEAFIYFGASLTSIIEEREARNG